MVPNSLASQRRVIVTSAMVTLTVGVLAGFERGEGLPTARFLIGVGMAFTICSIMTDLGSPMGAGFAGLILIAALLYQGDDALRILGKRSGSGKSKVRKASKRTARNAAAAVAAGFELPDTPSTYPKNPLKGKR